MSKDIVPIRDIILEKEVRKVESLHELLEYFVSRESYFTSTLAAITSHEKSSLGWQRIFKRKDGLTHKNTINGASKDGVFTGEYWCQVACKAVADALQVYATANSIAIVVEMCDFAADYFGENGPDRMPLPDTVMHSFLRISDTKSGEKYYLDPTYAQIDHRYAGKFLLIRENEFANYYKSATETHPETTPITEYRMIDPSKLLSKPDSFTRLKNTLR